MKLRSIGLYSRLTVPIEGAVLAEYLCDDESNHFYFQLVGRDRCVIGSIVGPFETADECIEAANAKGTGVVK